MEYPCNVLVEINDDEVRLVRVQSKDSLIEDVRAEYNLGISPGEHYSYKHIEKNLKILGYFNLQAELLSWET